MWVQLGTDRPAKRTTGHLTGDSREQPRISTPLGLPPTSGVVTARAETSRDPLIAARVYRLEVIAYSGGEPLPGSRCAEHRLKVVHVGVKRGFVLPLLVDHKLAWVIGVLEIVISDTAFVFLVGGLRYLGSHFSESRFSTLFDGYMHYDSEHLGFSSNL